MANRRRQPLCLPEELRQVRTVQELPSECVCAGGVVGGFRAMGHPDPWPGPSVVDSGHPPAQHSLFPEKMVSSCLDAPTGLSHEDLIQVRGLTSSRFPRPPGFPPSPRLPQPPRPPAASRPEACASPVGWREPRGHVCSLREHSFLHLLNGDNKCMWSSSFRQGRPWEGAVPVCCVFSVSVWPPLGLSPPFFF